MQRTNCTRRRRNTIIVVLLTLPLFAAEVVLAFRGVFPFKETIVPFILTFALIAVLMLAVKRAGGERLEGDERTERIEGRAFCYSWLITLYALTVLMLNDKLGLWPIGLYQGLVLVLVVMVASLNIFKVALNRAGDLRD